MEDFVTFDLAKKLKEKGFDIPCTYAYCKKGGWNVYTQKHEPITYILRTDGNPFGAFYAGNNWNVEYKTNKNKICCSAPTISQVLKWLRNEKKIHICIDFNGDIPPKWYYQIAIYGSTDIAADGYGYNDYETAVLAGIEYVLDNII